MILFLLQKAFRNLIIVRVLTCNIVVFGISNTAMAQYSDDSTAITATLRNYLDGGTEGDSTRFAKAFHPSGQMLFIRNDSLRIVILNDFMTSWAPKNKQDRKTKIERIQIFGNAAQAKLTIEYPTFLFHDMMSLLKTEQGWKVVSKIFYREVKQAN